MHVVTHAAIGAGIGAVSAQVLAPPLAPAAAFAAGLVSHAAADAIPHRDSDHLGEVGADLALAGVLSWWLLGGASGTAMLFGIVGAVLPDLEVALVHLGLLQDKQRIFPSHTGRVPHGRAPGLPGMLTQLPFLAAGIWLARLPFS